jgi:predicted nucleic acid-binding protein
MASYFCDSSGLVKRYASEVGTAWVQSITDPAAGHIIIVSRITGAEVVAAIWRKVREGTISAAGATLMSDDFKDHFRHQYRVVEVRAGVVEEAMNLVPQHGLRGYDTVQLASAKLLHLRRQAAGLPALTFVSADDALLVAAQAEGLTTENPNNHP